MLRTLESHQIGKEKDVCVFDEVFCIRKSGKVVLNQCFYLLNVQRIFFGFKSHKEICKRKDSMCYVSSYFIKGFFSISRIVHQSKMFPIKEVSGIGMSQSKIRIINLPIVLLQIDYVKTCKTAKNPYRY